MIGLAFWVLASGQALELAGAPQPPARLVCRYETPVNPLFYRRKMCLTQAEWDYRDRAGEAASRKRIYEIMGNTACLSGGLCTSD